MKDVLSVIVISILFFFSNCTSESNNKNRVVRFESDTSNWVVFDYDSIICYVFLLENADSNEMFYPLSIISDGKLNPSTILTSRIKLDSVQSNELKNIMKGFVLELYEAETYPGKPDCFESNHGFVYYSKGKPVADISPAVHCERIYCFPQLPKNKHINYSQFKILLNDIGMPIYRKELNQLKLNK